MDYYIKDKCRITSYLWNNDFIKYGVSDIINVSVYRTSKSR
jgi:hypothetical protein